MKWRIGDGRLSKSIALKKRTIVPYSETIQRIEVTRLADGTVREDSEYVAAEQSRIIEALRGKYGEIDESQITWVMVHRNGDASPSGLDGASVPEGTQAGVRNT